MKLITAAEVELRCRHGERRLAIIREEFSDWFQTRIVSPYARGMLVELGFDILLDDVEKQFDQLRREIDERFDKIQANALNPSNP